MTTKSGKPCECEHIAHTERGKRTPNGNPGHKYGTHFHQLTPVKTDYGIFNVCPDCAADCMATIRRVNPVRPLRGHVEGYAVFNYESGVEMLYAKTKDGRIFETGPHKAGRDEFVRKDDVWRRIRAIPKDAVFIGTYPAPPEARNKNPAPRIGTRKPLRRSQVTGKKPTRRLVGRRIHNTQRGYFPNPSSGVRIVHNKLLGGWYIVRGPHHTPISGRFDSKEAAQAHLRDSQAERNRRVSFTPGRNNNPLPPAADGRYVVMRESVGQSKVRLSPLLRWETVASFRHKDQAIQYARIAAKKDGKRYRIMDRT